MQNLRNPYYKALVAILVLFMLFAAGTSEVHAVTGITVDLPVKVSGAACNPAIYAEDGTEIQRISAAPGDSKFSIFVDFIGSRTYRVRLTDADTGSVTYDKAEYEVKIYTVVESGELKAAPVITPLTEGKPYSLDFENKSTSSDDPDPDPVLYPADFDPPVKKIIKVISGEIKEMPTFIFRMVPEKKGQPMPDIYDESLGYAQATVVGDGETEFGIAQVGPEFVGQTLRYRLYEVPEEIKGFTYDTTNYTVILKVRLEGNQVVVDKTTISSDNKEVEMAVFTNVYEEDTPDTPKDEPTEPGDPDDPIPEKEDDDTYDTDDPMSGLDDPEESEEDEDETSDPNDHFLPQTGSEYDTPMILGICGLVILAAALILALLKKKKTAAASLLISVIIMGWGGASYLSIERMDTQKSQEAAVRSAEVRGSILSCIEEFAQQENAEPVSEYIMPVSSIEGQDYIGIIDIPAAGVSLPVNETWSYRRLDSTPCRYTGSLAGNDLVICAHNWDSQFGPVRSLKKGDSVYIKSVNGSISTYTVDYLETVQPEDVEYMTDFGGGWDLTLFTCTTGGKARVAVRCIAQESM